LYGLTIARRVDLVYVTCVCFDAGRVTVRVRKGEGRKRGGEKRRESEVEVMDPVAYPIRRLSTTVKQAGRYWRTLDL